MGVLVVVLPMFNLGWYGVPSGMVDFFQALGS